MSACWLLIIAAVAAASAQQRPAALDSRTNRDFRPDDSKVEVGGQDAAGSCPADQIGLKHQHAVKQTQANRDEMLRQSLSSAAVHLRAAVPPVLPHTSSYGKKQVLRTFEPSPGLRSANSSTSSLIALVHPDDDKILDFGKHRGKTYITVLNFDPGYCSWVKNEPKPNGKLESFQRYINDKTGMGNPQNRRRLDKKNARVQVRHVPLAFASEGHLNNWTVSMVQMTWRDPPENLLEEEDQWHRFVKRMV